MVSEQRKHHSTVTVGQGHILVVDDEDLIRETVAMALQEEGYTVSVAENGSVALSMLTPALAPASIVFDLAILDLMLPGVNGLDLCRMIRHQNLDMPILMLSARSSETDRVVGLEVGADDYLAKPFGMRELIARCRALVRRYRRSRTLTTATVLTHKGITLHLDELRVLVMGEEVALSPKEFRILELFMAHPQQVWSREALIDKIWGGDFVGDRKTVDVHIRWLREKIEPDPSHPEYIVTLRGFGYRFG
ncbi:MAG: response regulator transcription factor [Leptolyngbya sp. RL_3_1]|nr:response regulator transcription factor [Leptolyngbya sp. RL_3_1]